MNSKETFERITDFVQNYLGDTKQELTRETDLQKNLKIWGDEADEFIEKFSNEFNVDISELDLNKYFYQEGDRILPSLINFFKDKSKDDKPYPLTLGDLEKAIEKGKLV